MTSATSGEVLSGKEREFLQGLHDEKYYQYRANLRTRIQNKVESIARDLPLLLGNVRLDNTREKYDWDQLVAPIVEYARKHLDYDTVPVKVFQPPRPVKGVDLSKKN